MARVKGAMNARKNLQKDSEDLEANYIDQLTTS